MLPFLALFACGHEPTADNTPVDTSDPTVEPDVLTLALDPDPPLAGRRAGCALSVPDGDDPDAYSWAFFVDGEQVDDALVDVGQEFGCAVYLDDAVVAEVSGAVEDPCTSLEGLGHLEDDGGLGVGQGGGVHFTAEAWFKTNALEQTQAIYWKQDDGSASSRYVDWGVTVTDEGQIAWATGLSDDACAYLKTEPGAVEVGAWTHVAVQLMAHGEDVGTKTVFLDGQRVAECEYETKNDLNDGPLYVGNAMGGFAFDGLLDELHVSNTVRYTEDFTPSRYVAPDQNSHMLWHVNADSDLVVRDYTIWERHLLLDEGTTTDSDGVCD